MRVCLVLESNTDVRLIEGLVERSELSVLARKNAISEFDTDQTFDRIVGPQARARYLKFVFQYLAQYQRFDFVIAQGYGVAALGANLAARRTKVSTAMFVCNPSEVYYRCRREARDPDMPFRRRELILLHLAARINARLGSRYIVLSRYLADVVRGHGARTPIAVIPVYGVDTKRFYPRRESIDVIKTKLGIPREGFTIFFGSRLAPEKDLDTLLQACSRLRDEGRNIWLLNRSRNFQRVKEIADSYGIGDRVLAGDMVHPVEELPKYIQAANVFVQSSRAEGLGFGVLEALACGTPVVATDIGGLRETINDGETGWTYPVGDALGLSRVIADALDRPEEAALRTQRGQQMVDDRYRRGKVFAMLEQMMDEG